MIYNNIRLYPFDTDEDDEEEVQLNESIRVCAIYVDFSAIDTYWYLQEIIPFAVVGSENNVLIDGKSVRGRKNRWGVVNVEDANHCEFVHLRNFLTRSVRIINVNERLLSVDVMLLGHTCRTSSRRLRKSTMRRSGRSSYLRSRKVSIRDQLLRSSRCRWRL